MAFNYFFIYFGYLIYSLSLSFFWTKRNKRQDSYPTTTTTTTTKKKNFEKKKENPQLINHYHSFTLEILFNQFTNPSAPHPLPTKIRFPKEATQNWNSLLIFYPKKTLFLIYHALNLDPITSYIRKSKIKTNTKKETHCTHTYNIPDKSYT